MDDATNRVQIGIGMSDMDPDIKERLETLLHGERQLDNGHRGDPDTLSTQSIIQSKCIRVLMSKVSLIERKCIACKRPSAVNWPMASIICAILLTLLRIFNK